MSTNQAASAAPVPEQLVLDLQPLQVPNFSNFVTGANAEALAALQRLAANPADLEPGPIYLCGPSGAGKTHLLQAVTAALRAGGHAVGWVEDDGAAPADDPAILIVDRADSWSAELQAFVFNAINDRRQAGRRGLVLAAGREPPAFLPLREDVTTRLGWGLVYALRPPGDEAMVAALREHARGRGIDLTNDVTNYMLTHATRDFRALLGIIDRLDRLSLARKRAITVPLLKQVLDKETTAS